MNFLGPGLDMTEELIDSHFDKIPTKVFDKNTYKPKSRRSSRRNSQQANSGSDSDSEDRSTHRRQKDKKREKDHPIAEVDEYDDMHTNTQGIPRYSGEGSQGQTYTHGSGQLRQYDYAPASIYSNDPPRFRPQYVPTPPPGQGYPTPSGTYSPFEDQRRDRHYDSDDDHRPPRSSRRPKAVTRRSSSYHGPRDRYDYYNSYDAHAGGGQQLQRRTGSDTEPGKMAKAKDINKRHGVKDEMEDLVTTSRNGLAGGAVGAVVGGWAANKAQVAFGKDKGRHGSSANPLLTLLGAAAGGLAADVLVAKWEDKKRETEMKDKKWDKKWGDERSEYGSRGESARSRRRRNSYSD